MVEENFKIGINLELEQSSLADLEKQIERTIKNATQKAMGNVKLGSTGPGTSSIKGAASAVGVKGTDFPKAIQSVMKGEFKSFDASVAQMTKSMDRLAAAMEKQNRSGGASTISPTTATGGPRKPDPATGVERAQKEVAKRINALRAKSAKGEGGTDTEAKIQKEKAKFAKITSQQTRLAKKATTLAARNAAVDAKLISVKEEEAAIRKQFIANLRRENSSFSGGSAVSGPRDPLQATKNRPTVGATQRNQKTQSVNRLSTGGREESAGSLVTPKTSGRTGDGPTDSPGRKRALARQDAANVSARTSAPPPPPKAPGRPTEPPARKHVDYQKQAQSDAKAAAATLNSFVDSVVKHMPQYKGKDLRSELNIPNAGDIKVREGATATIKSASGKERHIGSVVKVLGENVSRLDRITHDMQGIDKELAKIAAASRRRPGSEKDAIQSLVRKKVFGSSPLYEKHQSMGSFVKGGETKMIFEPNQQQAERIMSKGEQGKIDAPKLGEVEALFHDLAKASGHFVSKGMDVISMLGMTEEAASDMAKATNWTLAKNKDTGQFEGGITNKMQTRQVQQFQAGGAGFGKQARSLFMKGFAKIEGGQAPVIQSPYHREMMEKGNIAKSARNLKTSVMSAKNVPELHEDQSLITHEAAKSMGMYKSKTKRVKDPAEDLMVGMPLQDKQTMGVNAAGKKVAMSLAGTYAEITAMNTVIKNGVKMTAITYDEFNAPGTGMKGTTMPGNKSIMKAVSQDYMDKLGAPKGTEVLTSVEGMSRRGDLQDVAMLISTSMADGGKVAAQQIFDSITSAMKSKGMDLLGAAKQAGKEFGIDPNVAMKSTSGALAAGGVGKSLTGTLPWYRLEKEGQTGESGSKDRYMDPVSISALKQRSETLAYAMAAEERAHNLVSKQQVDYHKVLRSMTGESENVTAGLQKMNPEDFKRMPKKTVAPEDMAGTIVDPEFMKSAFNMQIPKMGGGSEDFFMPGIGTAVGQRKAIDTEEGLMMSNDLSKSFENFRQSAVEVKAARGELDPKQSPEVQQEGAEYVNRMMNQQIEAISTATGAEGKAMASQFVDTWMPVVSLMDKAGMKAGIAWKKISTTGKETQETFRGKPSAYVGQGRGDFQKANRIRDMVALRSSTGPVAASEGQRAKGVEATAAIGSAGAIFKDIEILDAALKRLGATAGEDAVYMGTLWKKLEEGRSTLLDKISEQGFGKTGTPGREELRRVAQTKGSGLMEGSQYSKAIEYNVDIGSELKYAEQQLKKMAAAGGDVGDALSALERIKSLQVSEDILPRDAILLSQTDYQNMKAGIKKDAKKRGESISDEDVEARMQRGLMGRFPITGGESHHVAKFMEDKSGKLPEGKVGIPGTFASSSTADLQKMRAPLEKFRDSLVSIIATNGGFGDAADEARSKLKEVNSVVDALTQSFHKSTTNLDFDGDNVIQHAANSKEAAQTLRTSVEVLKQFGFSAQNALRTIKGNVEGKDHDFQSLEGINASFGALAKGRPAELMGAIPVPEDAATANREAQGLVGGKLSVGLLSDAFNIFHQAVIGGSKLTGDAFATAKDFMMLNINKSLAAKHGSGDAAGPMELLDDLKKGPAGLKNIFKGMDTGGGGVYGEMGDMNKKMRDKMSKMLPAMNPADLMEMALKEGILKEGQELNPSNFTSVIASLLDKLDLKGQLNHIWEMIESNFRESLSKQGMSTADIEAQIKKSTVGPKAEGIDLRSLTSDAFQISRRKGSKALQEKPSQDRAMDVLKANFEDITDSMEGVEIDTAAPRKLSSDLQSWLAGIMEVVGVLSDSDLKGMGYDPKKVGGMYQEGPPGSTPGSGAVMVGESSRVSPLKTSIDALGMIETGQIRALPDIIDMATKSIERMRNTVGHERVHQALKVPGTSGARSKEQISTQLMEGSGAIGSNRGAIMAAANKLPSIAAQSEKFESLKKISSEQGPDAVLGRSEGLEEFTGMGAGDAVAQQGKKYMDRISEEILAHLTNPSKWMDVFGAIPAEVGMVFVKMFGDLKGEMPDLLGPLEATSSELMGRVQSLKQKGTPQAADVRAEAMDRIAGNGPLRERGRRVEDIEEILAQGRVQHGLTPGTRKGLTTQTEGDVSFPMEGREGLDTSATGMRLMLKKMSEGGGVGGTELEGLRGRFMDTAKEYKGAVSNIPKREGGGYQQGNKAYLKAMQEFQAAEVQMYLNQAKQLEEAANVLNTSGMADTPQFREVVSQLDSVIERMMNNLMQLKVPGSSKMAGLAMSSDGGLQDRAFDIGIRPSKENYEELTKRAGPRDPKESKQFMSGLGGSMLEVLDSIKQGQTRTTAWLRIWDELADKPKELEANLGVVADILKQFSSQMFADLGPNDAATKNIQAMAKTAKDAHDALAKMPVRVKTEADVRQAQATLPAVRKAAFGGRDIKSAIEEQQKGIEAARQKWEGQLNAMHKQGVTPAGGRHLDRGKSFDVIDPESNTVIKKFTMNATRGMNGYTVSLKEATNASKAMTGSIRNSLRRVVQWGFATGIVYGTIRAFREMVQVITEVETKIAGLKKVMDTSITNFVKMQDAAAGFAQEFGVSIEDVLDGMVVYGQQGLKVNKIMERTRATMLAVNVTTLSSVNATEALTAAHKVFGDAVSGSTGFVDAWAAVAARHAITAEDLADAVKRSGAAAGVAGVGFNDFLGVVTAIGAVTRQTGKEIATSTKFMFRAMRRPTAQKNLGKQGIQSFEEGGDFRPAMDIMKELAGTWDSLTRAQQVNTAQAMAGIRHYNSFIVLMNNFDEALLASADAANSQGFAMRKNRMTMATFSKQMGVMKESVKAIALEFGKSFLGPITTGVEIVSKLVQTIGGLPPALTKATVMAAGMGLAFHKAADFISDGMDAMSSGNVSMGDSQPRSSLFRKMAGGAESIGDGWRAAGAGVAGKDAAKELTKSGRSVHLLRRSIDAVGKSTISVTTGIMSWIPGLGAATTAARGFSAAMITTVGGAAIIAIGVALAYAYSEYKKATITAKEFEQSQEDIIGKSEDTASTLRSQLVTADRLSLAYKKIGTAMSAMGDGGGTAAALAEGRFKGAATAAQKYSDMLAEVGNNIAKADPSKVMGISDTGDFIVGIEDNFKSMTQAALDAQNALTVSLKADVISAYSAELSKTLSIWDRMAESVNKFRNLAQKVTGGDLEFNTDMSAIGNLKATTREIQKITATRKQQASEGGFQIVGQAKLLELVKRRGEEEQKVLAIAENVKRVFESMPVFSDISAAMQNITPKMQEELKIAVDTGQFGRGATLESVMTQFMGKQAGLGGILDYKNTQSAGLTANAFLERGIKAQSGSGAASGVTDAGQIGILSKSAADQLTGGVQTLFSAFDSATGKIVFQYRDIAGDMQRVTSEAIEEAGRSIQSRQGEIADQFITWTQKEVSAAAEATSRLLTTQYAGASAGIRVPEGGMPDTGPSRAAELTIEQRIMKSMPESVQRLADVQKEYNALAQEYSEILLSDVKGAYTTAGTASKELKVATQDVLELAVRLQKEGFHLSVIANYEKMQQQLAQTLEQSARAAEDYESAERNKNRYITSPAGAMAGMPAIPQLDLGKSFKELSGLEKLSLETPGFGKTLRGVASKTAERDRNVGTLNELESQLKDFEEAVRDMGKAGTELEAAGDNKVLTAMRQGASKGQQAMIRAMNEDAMKQLGIGDKQLSVQQSMLDKLGTLVKLAAEPDGEAKREIYNKELRGASFENLTSGFGSIAGGDALNDLKNAALGLRTNAQGEVEPGSRAVEGVDQATVRDLARMQNAIAAQDALMNAAGGGVDQGFSIHGMETQNQDRLLGFGNGNEYFANAEAAQATLDERTTEFFVSSAAAMKALQDKAIEMTSSPERFGALKKSQAEKDNVRLMEVKEQAAQKENTVRKAINEKIIAMRDQLEEGNTELTRASKEIRIAQSARDLATSLKDMVKEFKAAEAAVIIKLKSDLEGPFARVGQPGFKTSFDQRREELKAGSNRPMSLDQMRSRNDERKKIDFDEKEAKIQQRQKIETDALRRQQGRAEQVRSKMQEIMSDPDQKANVRAEAKSYFETLGSELQTSEQATKRGDAMFFKGIPSLDNLEGMADKISSMANDQVRDLKIMDFKDGVEQGTSRLLSVQEQSLVELKRISGDVGSATDTGNYSTSAFGSTASSPPAGVDNSRVSSTARTSASASMTSSGPGEGLSRSEMVKAYSKAAQDRKAAIFGPESSGKLTTPTASEAGMGAATLSTLGTLLQGTSAAGSSTTGISTPMGKVTNTVQKIGDDLVVAASHLDGKIVGLQEFDVVSGEGGTKSLRARHISGETGSGLELDPKLQGKGVGSDRLAKVMEYGQEKGFSALESSDFASAEQTGAYESAGRKTGLDVLHNLDGAADSAALRVPLKPQGMMDKVGNFRAGQEGAFTGGKLAKGGKILGAAGVGLEAYQMASTMVGAESAQTPEELNKYGNALGGQTLGIGGVAAMTAAGGAMAGPMGALGGGLLGGAGMVADHFSGAGSLDYAGKYWNEKSGGMFSSAAQMGGQALMAPGNWAGDMADRWNTRGVDMGPGTTAPAPQTAPISSDVMSAYAAAAPTTVDKNAPGYWESQIAAKMQPAASDTYSALQMAPMGADTGQNFFPSRSSGLGGTLIPSDVLDSEKQGPIDLNQYIEKMQASRAALAPQVGPSNTALQGDILNTNNRTQPLTPAAPTPDQRVAAQQLSSEQSSTTGGSNEALLEAISALGDRLEGLGELKLPETLTASLADISTALGDFGKDLEVTITNDSLDVNVTNIAEIPASTASDVGSAVTTLATVVSELQGRTEINQGDIQDLSSASDASDAALETAVASIQTELEAVPASIDEKLDAASITIQSEVETTLNAKTEELDGKLTPITEDAAAVRALVESAVTTVEEFAAPIEAATQTALEAKIAADAATLAAGEAGVLATSATSSATLAAAEAKAATEAINEINETVERNRQTHITDQSAINTKIGDYNVRIETNKTAAGEALSTAKRAENIAQAANSKPRS